MVPDIDIGPQIDSVLGRLNEHIDRIYRAMPRNSVLVLASGQGDTAMTRAVQDEKRRRRRASFLSKWDKSSEAAFKKCCEESRHGMCHVTVKNVANDYGV